MDFDNDVPVGSVWIHVKSGKTYAVVGHCYLEREGVPAILYAKPEDVHPWAREAAEFLDGRFVRIHNG